MASSTTNLGLIKPAGNEKIRIAQINQNSDTIDNAIGAVGSTSLQAQVGAIEDGIAIVANGDSHVAITAGQFVYVRNNTHNLAEGLYVASANVSANGSITSSNMTADASGGLNALNAKIETKAKSTFLSWGTTFTAENFHHGLLILALNDAYIVWFASTSAIGIRSLRSSDGTKTEDGSITFGVDNVSGSNHTITRNGNTLSFTTNGSTTATLLYV